MTLSNGAALAALITVFGIASGAHAHARLIGADPKGGATPRASPKTIRATFNEPLIAAFSSLSLITAKGGAVPLGKATLAPGDPRTLMASVLGPLAPGDYVVHWRAVSADTHKTAGDYGFRIEP
jgi:methionine-rich copper-binding protein CopC